MKNLEDTKELKICSWKLVANNDTKAYTLPKESACRTCYGFDLDCKMYLPFDKTKWSRYKLNDKD